MKKILSFVLAFALVFTAVIPVHANEIITATDATQFDDVMLDEAAEAAVAADSSKVLSIRTVYQNTSDNCWAACVASLLSFLNGPTKTAQQVCNDTGYFTDIGMDVVQNIILPHYRVESLYYSFSSSSFSTLKNLIDSYSKPIMVSIVPTGSGSSGGHGVVVYGYSVVGTRSYLYIMDPEYGNSQIEYDIASNWYSYHGMNVKVMHGIRVISMPPESPSASAVDE